MFDIWYLNDQHEKNLVWQTSWGLSTRSIGAMIMVHSDDQGLVLPPKVANTQVVIIAIEKQGQDSAAIFESCARMRDELAAAGIRVEWDDSTIHKSGWKFNHWEQRGVPIRLEVGKRDQDAGEVRCCKRHNGEKMQLKQEGIVGQITAMLDSIHNEMFDKALKAR